MEHCDVVSLETVASPTTRKEQRASMIYSLLPTVIQNRIPTLPSIRRSMGDFHTRTVHAKSASLDSEIFIPSSPPPLYCSRSVSGETTPNRLSTASTDVEDICFRDEVSERPDSSRSTVPPPFEFAETESGINWKYANQGINLLTQAYQESIAVARDPNEGSAMLTRQLYMHGMSYLLRGLPANPTQEEILGITAATPVIFQDFTNNPDAHALTRLSKETEITQTQPTQEPSLLHRITATVIFQTFLLIQLLLPYIKLFIGHAYRFEREHKVTQRFLNTSLATAEEVRRRSLRLSQTVCQMNDGKVGQTINDLTIWWVRGLTGGIQEGITQGVVVFGNEGARCPKGRVEKLD